MLIDSLSPRTANPTGWAYRLLADRHPSAVAVAHSFRPDSAGPESKHRERWPDSGSSSRRWSGDQSTG